MPALADTGAAGRVRATQLTLRPPRLLCRLQSSRGQSTQNDDASPPEGRERADSDATIGSDDSDATIGSDGGAADASATASGDAAAVANTFPELSQLDDVLPLKTSTGAPLSWQTYIKEKRCPLDVLLPHLHGSGGSAGLAPQIERLKAASESLACGVGQFPAGKLVAAQLTVIADCLGNSGSNTQDEAAGILSAPNLAFFRMGSAVTRLLAERVLRFTCNGVDFVATAARFDHSTTYGMQQAMPMLGNAMFGRGVVPSLPLFLRTSGVDSQVTLCRLGADVLRCSTCRLLAAPCLLPAPPLLIFLSITLADTDLDHSRDTRQRQRRFFRAVPRVEVSASVLAGSATGAASDAAFRLISAETCSG